jgi:hypothetical protein
MMKIMAIACICLCGLVIAFMVKIYLESPKLKPEKKKKKKNLGKSY